MQEALTATQEADAQELARAIVSATEADVLEIARTLIGSTPATLFGANEFKVRDIVLRVAAKAYEQQLAQKKTATRGPA